MPATARWRGVLLPALLFAATAVTTLIAGAEYVPELVAWADVPAAGLPYAAAILAILGAHEMGHYAAARVWGVDTTLPWFIPGLPFAAGTFGAVIRIRSALPSRRAVLDIGAAGPIAGFLVALPLLVLGIQRSALQALPGPGPLLPFPAAPFHLLRSLLAGATSFDYAGHQVLGESLLSWSVERLVLGPIPAGFEVLRHPVAYAAWIGLLVTTLNLLPIGQLDGGHVLYAWLGPDRARRLSGLVSAGLLACGIFLSWNWLVWWAITRYAVRLSHPRALDEAPLGPGRRLVAALSLLLFALTFIPVPVSM